MKGLLFLVFLFALISFSACKPFGSQIFFPEDDQEDRVFDRIPIRGKVQEFDVEEDVVEEEEKDNRNFGNEEVEEVLKNRNTNTLGDDDEDEIEEDSSLLANCTALRNALPFEGRCFDITTQGPCQSEDEWFVLDEDPDVNGDPRGVCRLRDCVNPDEVLFEGECRAIFSRSKCGDGKELLINPFGQGECDCRENYLPFQSEFESSFQCFPSHLTGPCEPGLTQYEPVEDAPLGAGCVAHNCSKGQIRWREDSKCHEELDCGDDFEFGVDETRGESSCLVVRQIITIPKSCPEGQTQNHDGECVQVVRLFGSSGSSRPTRRLALGTRTLSSFLSKRFG